LLAPLPPAWSRRFDSAAAAIPGNGPDNAKQRRRRTMTKVTLDISMSLDGFMTAANQRPEEPLGEGGEQLHHWAFGDDPRDREVLAGGGGPGPPPLEDLGAVQTPAATHLRFRVVR